MKLFSFLFFLAFLVIPKTGQAEDLARFFPTESLIYVGSSGVGELDDAFNKSKAGKLWNQPRFESLRNFLEKLPKQISDSFNARGNSDHDEIPALSPFEDFINMQAGLLPGLADAMQHGVAFGIADIIIDPIEPEVIAYLIIDAGDESERYKNVFARNLMGLALTDPRIELLNEISWTVLEIEAQPAAELWWTIHENRAIFALGSTSARTYLAMSNGERTSMLEDEIYKAGMYRCIGNSSVTSSIQIDLPGIVGLVLDTFQEFGGDPPAEADYFIDEISRIGALHYASGHTNGDEPVFTAGTSFPYKGISVTATGITDESLALGHRYFCQPSSTTCKNPISSWKQFSGHSFLKSSPGKSTRERKP
jgi:hypothetical protein